MTAIITADQQLTLTAVFKDASGGDYAPNLADPHAPQPLWTEDSKGTVVVISPSEDQLACTVVGIAPGTAQVTCKDRGTDKQATETVVVREGGIAAVAISVGAPERQATKVTDKPADLTPPGEFNPHLGGVALGESEDIHGDAANAPVPPAVQPPPEGSPI